MEKVCKKHQETPAIMYGECIGCELEKVRAREREACALLVEKLYLPEAAAAIRARGKQCQKIE